VTAKPARLRTWRRRAWVAAARAGRDRPRGASDRHVCRV